jgi:hypothetical protein
MTKIVITQGSWGMWTAEHVDGWDKQEVKDLDREQALLRLLAEMGIEVAQQGEYWMNGERSEWQISNMKKGD